ncbi:DUF362 domain-containing protein [Limnoglobus roseus]|uniref:DUF362 domain-containing protein n=1 Tax=Limnoglobus roseus TaxID=2598579 RepID=A0A5C1AGN9_9BACT|nr:DUF362 domain-containing protein [Limnoglobus roseus]QEL17317.1 hypothetical protein PX52LOC_04300 [Limnoglobus roseus]
MIDARQRLWELATTDGGWGYHAGQPPHLEPTCLALLALAPEAAQKPAAWEAARRFVASQFVATGKGQTVRLQRGRPQAVWPTALTLFTWANGLATGNDLANLAEGLFAVEARTIKTDPEVADMHDIDSRLMGWPWGEDTFSWVEPTSWACLALRKIGRGDHPRVREGLRLLLDRAFDTGGANYGNRSVLGKSTEPIPGPTAVLLLAMQGFDHPRIDAAKGYLRVHGEQTTDLEHLAWIKLALACHATDDATRTALPQLDRHIRESLEAEATPTNGLGAGPLRLALAALALDVEARNPFRLSDTPQPSQGEPAFVNRTNKAVSKKERMPLGERVRTYFQGINAKMISNTRPLPRTSAVHIGRCGEYDEAAMRALLKTQFGHFREHVPAAGKRVVLKPNLVEYHRGKVINTDPRFVDAVIQLFKDEGAAEIIVAEGPGHWRNVQFLVNESGLGDVLRKHGVRFVDVNHDEPRKMLNLGRTTGLEHLYISRTVAEADVFVSLPKLKTHHWAGATLSLKNLFGTLPGICYGWPKNELHWRGIPNSIVDIACTNTPHLAIVDGIIGMEGDGPLNGTAKPFGALVMGIDLVAVDATCCRLMKLPVERIPTIVLAHEKRLGNIRADLIPQLGEAIASLAQAFVPPPEIEKQLIPERLLNSSPS